MSFPYDHFWLAEDGRVYASARQSIVDREDAAYKAFIAADGIPTGWPRDADEQQTNAALKEVLDGLGFYLSAKDALKGYASQLRFAREIGGVDVAGNAVKTDRESQSLIMGAMLLVQRHPQSTVRFKTAGGFVEMDADAVNSVADAVAQHVQTCFAKEADVAADIDNGNITTREQVNTAFA